MRSSTESRPAAGMESCYNPLQPLPGRHSHVEMTTTSGNKHGDATTAQAGTKACHISASRLMPVCGSPLFRPVVGVACRRVSSLQGRLIFYSWLVRLADHDRAAGVRVMRAMGMLTTMTGMGHIVRGWKEARYGWFLEQVATVWKI